MAVSYLTSSELIASVKRRASIPINQNTFTDEDILALANEELAIGLVPSILQLHEEYFVNSTFVDLVANKPNYAIPSRAIGNKLRMLSFCDQPADNHENGSLFEMTRLQPENRYEAMPGRSTNAVYRFMVKNNDVVLIPAPDGFVNGSLEMNFYLRPNAMVTEDRAGIITDIDRNNGIITVSEMPDVFGAGNLYDFVKVGSPHKIVSYDVPVLSVDTITNTITMAVTDIPDDLVVTDSIMLAGETIVPNVPTDLHVVLAHRVAARCLEALGDTQGLANANAKLAEMEVKTGNLIDNRVEGSPQKVIIRHGLLKGGKFNRRRRWF